MNPALPTLRIRRGCVSCGCTQPATQGICMEGGAQTWTGGANAMPRGVPSGMRGDPREIPPACQVVSKRIKYLTQRSGISDKVRRRLRQASSKRKAKFLDVPRPAGKAWRKGAGRDRLARRPADRRRGEFMICRIYVIIESGSRLTVPNALLPHR
jgi:hypothetical protein